MTGLLLQAANNTTNATLANASANLTNSFSSSFQLAGPLVAILVIAVAAVFVGNSVSRIEWVHQKLKAFSETLYYTAVGLASTIVVAVVSAPFYLLGTADGETQAMVGYAAIGLIVAYAVFTGLGYLVHNTILATWSEYRNEIQADTEASD